MHESHKHARRSGPLVAIHFRTNASSDEVVPQLFKAIRGTDLSLLAVFADGQRVHPSEVGEPARLASSWRAELFWHSPTLMSGWRLEVFLTRVKTFLELPGRPQLEIEGGRRRAATASPIRLHPS